MFVIDLSSSDDVVFNGNTITISAEVPNNDDYYIKADKGFVRCTNTSAEAPAITVDDNYEFCSKFFFYLINFCICDITLSVNFRIKI